MVPLHLRAIRIPLTCNATVRGKYATRLRLVSVSTACVYAVAGPTSWRAPVPWAHRLPAEGPGDREGPARPFSVVAFSRTCEHGNQSEAQAAPVCVAMATPQREEQCRVPPRACAAERARGLVDAPRRRHGKRRCHRPPVFARQHAASSATGSS